MVTEGLGGCPNFHGHPIYLTNQLRSLKMDTIKLGVGPNFHATPISLTNQF